MFTGYKSVKHFGDIKEINPQDFTEARSGPIYPLDISGLTQARDKVFINLIRIRLFYFILFRLARIIN